MTPARARTVLNVPASASRRTVELAFRVLARRHHPDVGGDPKVFAELVAARAVLLDPDPGGPGVTVAVRRRDRRLRKVADALRRLLGRGSRRVI